MPQKVLLRDVAAVPSPVVAHESALRRLDCVCIGIDPGVKGGVCILSRDGIHLQPLGPLEPTDQWSLFQFFGGRPKGHVRVALEKVGGYVGGDGNTGASMFVFGEAYGMVRGFLAAAGIEYESVQPKSWMKVFGMKREKGENREVWKRRLKALAVSLYPTHESQITNATADALLIAEYVRRTRHTA